MQRPNEGISEILDIGELLVTVVNQQDTGEDAKNEQSCIREKRLRKDGSEHVVKNLMTKN